MYATTPKKPATSTTTTTPSKQTYDDYMSDEYYSARTPSNISDEYYTRASMSAPPTMGISASGNIPIVYESEPSPTRGPRNQG